MVMPHSRNTKVVTFSSFDEENKYEFQRRKNLSKKEKIHEFEILQQRRWGEDGTMKLIVKVVHIEQLSDRDE